MDRKDVIEITEGIKLIEEGIVKIQDVMRAKKIKSLSEVAAELIPVLGDDNSIRESIVQHLDHYKKI